MTNEITIPHPEMMSRPGELPDLRSQLRVERLAADLGEINWHRAVIPTPYVNDLRRSLQSRERLRQDIAELPSAIALERLAGACEDALEAKPSRKVTAVAVSLLFDSRVRQPANPVTYLSALCNDLLEMGFQPAVVAAACQHLRRTTTFIPEIAEVIEACRKTQQDYAVKARVCRHALEARDRAVAALEEAALPPEPVPGYKPSPDWNPDA